MKQPHNGKQTWRPENKDNKTSKDCAPKETKKKPEKPEQKKDEVNDESEESSHDYKEWRHDIKEVMHKAFSRVARGYPVDGIYFDGEKFYTDNQDGRATLLYTSDDIDNFLEENDMQESTVDDQTERFMQNRGLDIFEAIDWEEVEETAKHYDKWKR